MDCVMVFESSIVIHTFQMANMAHEWMNLCHVITHIIMVNEDHFTSTTFVNLTAVNCTIIIFAVLAGTSPVCFRNRRHSKGSWRAWCPSLLRSSLTIGVTTGGRLGKSMLHPLVLPQPLFRDGFEVTLITRRHTGSNFHFFNVVNCWMVLLVTLSSVGKSFKLA